MTNPYIDMLQAAPAAAPGGEPPANPYLDMLQSADEQRRQQMAGQLTQAVGVNPEQYTAQRRVAQYLGYPTPVVEAQPHLMGQAKVRQIQQDTANAPVLQRKYTDADFAKLAHDDAPILSKIETAVSSAVRYAMGADQYGGVWGDLKRGAWDNSVIGTAGAFRMVSELGASAAELVPAVRSLEASGQYGGNPLRRLAEGFAMIGANQQALKDASSPPAEGNIAGGVSSGFQSAGQNLKYLPLAFLGPVGWAAGLTGMVVESGGTTYQKDREEGVPMGTATIHAAADGLAEYVGERYFGEVGFLKRLAAGAPATKLLMWEITRDVPGEIGTTLWQNFNDWALTNPSKTADQFLREQPDAIVQTAIGALVGGGVQVGVGKLAMRTAETVLNRQMEVTETLQREESLKALMQLAGQAKLAERSPEQLQAFVAEASGDATVRFDAATLVDVFKQDANALAQALPSVDLQALQEAAATGGEVTVPLAELVVGVKAAGVDQTVLEHARLGDSTLSAAEARDVQSRMDGELGAQVAQAIAQAQDQDAARQSHEAVRSNIEQQITATGRHRPAVAEQMATWAASFFTTYGSRLGITAEEMYQRYPLRVVGAPTGQGGGVVEQGAQDQRDLVVTHNLTADNLLHAVKMGGLAVPSLAVTKKDSPLTEFGEITLIGDKAMADPKGYAGAKVFGADIYSPRYPNVTLEFTPNMRKRGEAQLKEGMAATGRSYFDWSEVERDGAREVARTAPFMWQFLTGRGIAPDVKRTEVQPLPPELAPFAESKLDRFDLVKDPGFVAAAWKMRRDLLVTRNEGNEQEADAELASEKQRVEERGKFFYANELARQVENYRRDLRDSGKIDESATRIALESQIREAGLTDELQSAAAEFISGLGPNERISQGFTNSGNRKYIAHTLENVVKILKKELRGGENFNYGVGSLRAKFTPQFKSIEQIRKAKDRLVSKEDFEKVKKEIDDQFWVVAASINKDLSSTTALSILEDAAKLGVKRAAKNYGYEISDDAAVTAAEFLTRLRELPTEYFEAKILRDVDLAEFAGAVVPEDADPRVIAALQARGVKDIRTYKTGDEADRKAKLGEFESLFFQNQQAPRGTFSPQTLELVLNPNANLSTWFHETGHFFLEVLADVGSQPDSPLADDWGKVLKWFGVTGEQWAAMDLDAKRPYHERWAESVEQYVMEGKAPSRELQPLMRKFAAWLIDVYRRMFKMDKGASPKSVVDQFLAQRGAQYSGPGLGQGAQAPVAASAVDTGKVSPITRKPVFDVFDASGRKLATTFSSKTADEAVTNYNRAQELRAQPTPMVNLDAAPAVAPKAKRATNWRIVRGEEFSNTDADDGYLYHITSYRAALDINREGLVPNSGRMFGDAYAGHSANRVFLTERSGVSYWRDKVEQMLFHSYDRPPSVAVVRIPKNKITATLQPDAIGSEDARAPAYYAEGEVLRQEDGKFKPTGQFNAALNDDIRRVMDRLLATDEQIAEANEVAGLVPDEAADGEAAERLRKRSIADLKWAVKARDKALAKLRRSAKDIEKGIRAQVTEEVNQRPEVQAKDALDKLRADKALDDASMAATADAFGFESPDAMLKAIDAFGKKSDAIDGMTERRMLEEHGDLIDERAIKEAANEAVHNEARARSLATELRTQAEMLNGRAIKTTDANENDAPIGAWVKLPYPDMRGQPVAQVREVNVNDLYLPELDENGQLQPEKRSYLPGYTDRVKAGERAPNITVVEMEDGRLRVVDGHRRVMAARAAGAATIRATVSPLVDLPGEGKVPATAELLGRQQAQPGQRKTTVNVLMEAAKQFGANVAQRTPLADVRAAVWRHTQAERRAAKRWQEATAAGKTEEAVKAKQDQTLQHAAARALIEAQDEVRKTLDFFKRVATGNDETVVKKGRDADIVNAARAVLAAYGVETPTTKRADDYLDVIKQNDPETYAAIAPMVDEATRNAQPLRALTVGELQALSEQIGALWYLAKRSRQMEIGGGLLDIDDLATQLNGRMEEIGIPDTVPGEAQAVTKREARALFIRQGLSFLKRVEQWAEGMDGRYGGPFLRYVFQPIKAAADAYRADRTAYRKKLEALVSNLAPIVGDKTIDAPELGYTFGGPDSTKGVAMNEVLHALLHTGNESNKRKLLLGRQWATENADGTLDTSRWDSFIQRLVATGKLQREHFDFVQGVWDLLEETKPLAQKAHRDAFGRYFAEVTAAPFVDPFGVPRKGGYVPAMVDPALVKDNALRKIAEAENESMSYAFPQPGKGFTMSRVEGYNRALMLDLRTIGQHLDKVLLFSRMTVPARSVRKLITNRSVSQPLDRIDPTALEVMLQPWLQRSAQQVVETPIPGSGGWARVPSIIRARAGMALMFANVSNAIQQATGLSTAMVKVKPGFIMRAMAQHVAHPGKAAAVVWEASSYMNDRAKNEVAVLNENMRDILLDPSPYEKAQAWSQRHAYFLQTAIDNALSPIVWTGAYNQAMADGMTHDDAVAFADGTVRQTQGSTLPEDVSRFETGPAYARAFTQFIGYFNMVANTNVVAIKQIAGEMGLKRGAGRLFSVVMLGMMIPIWAAEAIAQAFKGGPDDEDKDGLIVDDWLAAVFGFGTAKGLLAMVPIVGQAANSAVTRLDNNPMNDRISLSPGLSLIESAAGGNVQTVAELFNPDKDVNARRAVRDAASLVSIATGLPLYAIARPAGYAAGVAQGKIEPTGPVDAARGLITGTPSPESKVR